MATTKIWPVRDSLKRVTDYAANPGKTEYADLKNVISYAAGNSKTVSSEEKAYLVTGVNCSADSACEQMSAVKEHFGKPSGNVAYHAYQSFKPGEISPEECHQIGLELAKKLWGDRYQVLVATHLDKEHLHNHFIINSVSFIDGKKFNDNKAAYRMLRETSDDLCRQYGLSVIEKPRGKTPRQLYFAEKRGEPTKYNLMRWAIYDAISVSSNQEMFEAADIDGASAWQKIRYITIPSLVPTMMVLVLMAIGNIFRGDFGLFYQTVKSSALLQPTTDIIDTYVFRLLINNANIGVSAAVGLYQSVLCFITITICNKLVKITNPDYALY